MEAAVKALAAKSSSLRLEVATACAAIATDLGGTPPDVSAPSDEVMAEACQLALSALDQTFQGAILVWGGGPCTPDSMAQIDCETSFGCAAGDLEARCPELGGNCNGSCEGPCSASAGVECAGDCQGKCSGSCSGTCAGDCDGTPMQGTCAGSCEGICTGVCSGVCAGTCATLAPHAGCAGVCLDGCSAELTDLVCTEALSPSSCDPLCASICVAQAAAHVSCAPIVVAAYVPGVDPALVPTLEANLPALVACAEQLQSLATAKTNIEKALQTMGNCDALIEPFGDTRRSIDALTAVCTDAVTING